MQRRKYLDYLIDRVELDQSRALGAGTTTSFGVNVLAKGTYVWRVDNRFRNARSYRVKLRHAGSGNSGAFQFVLYNDKLEPGHPVQKQASSLNSRPNGQVSQWTMNNDSDTLFLGLNIPHDNTRIHLSSNAPPGFRGLDPHWLTGPPDASGSQLQPGASNDLGGVLAPGQEDLGGRFPAMEIEPITTGSTGLKDYYHIDFTADDDSEISEPQLCIEILLGWIAHTYPGGIIPFEQRADWDLANPEGTDRGYLDYLLERLTQQPVNFRDPDSLPDRLYAKYRINFLAPDTARAPRLQFLINILQEDLRGRGAPFDSYQQWENNDQRRRFPENFYTYWQPLVDPNEISAARLADVRGQIPQHHSSQVAMECLQRIGGMDHALNEARLSMARGEFPRAEAQLQSAEQSLAFLLKHNYGLQSKLTTSQHVRQIESEKQGLLSTPPLRRQLRDRALQMVHPELGARLSNIAQLLNPGAVSVVPDIQESQMYTRRVGRSRNRLDQLIEDVRRAFPDSFDDVLGRLITVHGNFSQLTNAEKGAVLALFQDLWLLVPHYMFFILALDFAECYSQLGQHERASRYYQLILDHERAGASQRMIYRYLNPAIEVPYITLKVAQNNVTWADRLHRRGGHENHGLARFLYRQCLGILSDHVSPSNPAAQRLSTLAEVGLIKLNRNLNALGYPNDFVPIFRYQFLIQLAEKMARHAVDAGRQLTSFMQQAEAAARSELEASQAVQLSESLIAVELTRLSQAQLDVEIAALQRAQVDQEIANLGEKVEELSDPVFYWAAWATGIQSGVGMAATGAALGGPIGALVGVIVAAEIGPGAIVGGAIGGVVGIGVGALAGVGFGYAQGAAQWKAHESQLNDQRRSKALLEQFGTAIADRRLAAAQIGQSIAAANVQIAQLRAAHAQELAALLETQLFSAERLYALAGQMRDIYLTYLRYANEIAFFAEQSLEYELNERINVIRFDYDDPVGQELLGAERLQLDLDALERERVRRYDEKRLPVTVSISIREEFPDAYFQLLDEGRASFRTTFDLFERMYPEAYQSRISRVELVFYALTPQEGLHGALSSSGISYVRDEQGNTEGIVNPPEKVVISKYRIEEGQVFFFDPREHYHPFEGMGVVTDWTIDLPKSANTLDYSTIFDVRLVIHYTTLCSDTLAAQVMGVQNPIARGMRMFSLRVGFPDAFYHLVNDGQAAFSLGRSHLPREHADGRIRQVMTLHHLPEKTRARKIDTELRYKDANGETRSATVSVDRTGPVVSQPSSPPFEGLSVQGDWDLSLALTDAAGASVGLGEDLKDVFLFIEYDYARGGLRYREAFEADPLMRQDIALQPSWTMTRRGGANQVNMTTGQHGLVKLEITNSGGADEDIDGPVVGSPIPPAPLDVDSVIQWTQLDHAAALEFSLDIVGADGERRRLAYAANQAGRRRDRSFVDMYPWKGAIGKEQTFRRRIFSDYLAQHGVAPSLLTGLRVSHTSNRKLTQDHGGTVQDIRLQSSRFVTLASQLRWTPGRLTAQSGRGRSMMVFDVGTPGYSTTVCRIRVGEAATRLDFWLARGMYRFTIGGDGSEPNGLFMLKGSYRSSEQAAVKIKKPVSLKPGRWYDVRLENHGKRVAGYVDDKMLAELDDIRGYVSSEIAIGWSKGDVEISGILSS